MQTELKILTPQGLFLQKEVDIVTAKLISGEMGIQANIVPFVSYMLPSEIKVNYSNSHDHIKIYTSGGIVFANKNNVKILVEHASYNAQEIDKYINIESNDTNKINTKILEQEIALKKELKRK